MKHSESIKAIAQALCDLQEEIVDVPKNQKAHNRMYANLQDTLDILRPLLKKHGLSMMQHPGPIREGNVSLETIIMHQSGEWIESIFEMPFIKLPTMNEPQSVGSIVSYARRYSLKGIFNMAEVDNDAESVVAPKQTSVPIPRITKEQAAQLKGLIENDPEPYMKRMEISYGVRAIEELTSSQFIHILDKLRVEGIADQRIERKVA